MLTPRRVILAAVALLAVAVTAGVVALLQPPDSSGLAADTYGTRHAGQRGLYETLEELGVPVERRLAPPDASLPTGSTVVLWGPDPDLVATEPRHLDRLRNWIERGGRLVVAPSSVTTMYGGIGSFSGGIGTHDVTIWDALQLDNVSTTRLEADDLPPPINDSADADGPGYGGLLDRLETLARESTSRTVVDVECAGSLAYLSPAVSKLVAPADELSVLSTRGLRGDGIVTFRDASHRERTVVAAFAAGEGEIVVVSDPLLFANLVLAEGDNSVLAAWLVAGDGQPVVFDEFYHGLSVRGNPLWLLTHPAYALLTVALVLLVAAATWRAGVLLGPPLTTPEPSRRTIGEYVDAMSRFFNRGRKTRMFLLEGVYAGVAWKIAREQGLHKGAAEIDEIAAVVARRDPKRAERLRQAAGNVDALRANGVKCPEREVLQAMADLTRCL